MATACYLVAWLLLPETLQKHKMKKLNPPPMTTNNGDVTDNPSAITSDTDLEEGGEKQPLLIMHRRKKMLVLYVYVMF